ncbi:hypothetical protein [Pedobacter glucosidilyticus]|uniref:hypothetical protein n=1 Tax=Pedobacter glucosidilyticus TaxID=1122941 RepID=UPI0003F71DD8|nr:hypothetical protein [Pedobacter glucosidilyticus]
MKLNVPADQAVKILEDRISELEVYGFDSKVWKARTVLDLREIFPIGSMQWLEVSHISFETYIDSSKATVMRGGKQTAKKLLSSFIEFIKDYSKVAEVKKVIVEKNYEQQYSELLIKWNSLVPEYNKLLENNESQLDINNGYLQEIEIRDKEIDRIKKETIQIDNVSFKKLCQAFFNLPTGQLYGFIASILIILGGAFTIGTMVEKTNSNNELFDLRNSKKQTEEQNEKLKNKYDSLINISKLQLIEQKARTAENYEFKK